MSNIPRDSTIIAAEAFLEAAGLKPTTVAHCDDDGCRWCGAAGLPVAA